MWISKKRWKELEKRVDDLEKMQSQPIKISKTIYEACMEEIEKEMKRNGKPLFNC